MFFPHQEMLIVDVVRQNNVIKLHDIQRKVIEDHADFEGKNSACLVTVDGDLKHNRMQMKQLSAL